MIDTSGNDMLIVNIRDKYGFAYMSLFYFKETYKLLEFE